jgi:hypothetical protein
MFAASKKFQPASTQRTVDPVDPSVRLAGDHDAYVESPVRDMQERLAFFEATAAAEVAWADDFATPSDELYPGWVRVLLPVAASAALWSAIIGSYLALR